MIIIMKPGAKSSSVRNIVKIIEDNGLQAHLSEGDQVTIIGAVGDKTRLSQSNIQIAPEVEKIVSVTESYKIANRQFHPDDSVIHVGNTDIGPHTLTIMAGPCAIENEEQLLSTARAVKKPAPLSCGAAHISPEPPPTLSRDWKKKG